MSRDAVTTQYHPLVRELLDAFEITESGPRLSDVVMDDWRDRLSETRDFEAIGTQLIALALYFSRCRAAEMSVQLAELAAIVAGEARVHLAMGDAIEKARASSAKRQHSGPQEAAAGLERPNAPVLRGPRRPFKKF